MMVSHLTPPHVKWGDTWGASGKLTGENYDLSGTKIGSTAQYVNGVKLRAVKTLIGRQSFVAQELGTGKTLP